jgi:hypothetical protein
MPADRAIVPLVIIELLQERDEQSRVACANGQDGMVLKAVLWHCTNSTRTVNHPDGLGEAAYMRVAQRPWTTVPSSQLWLQPTTGLSWSVA